MDNTAVQEKRKWTAEEFATFNATGEFPAWHEKAQAPDHSTGKRLCKSALRQKFEDYHQRHPEVYEWIVFFSHEMKNAGYRQYGMKSIIERVRWHINLNAPKDDSEGSMMLKINNNHAPFYSRLVIENEPLLRGFFEIREQAMSDGGL